MIKARFEDFIGRIREEVAAGNRSASQIGKVLGIRSNTIRRFAARDGIDLVGYGEAQRTAWELRKADPQAYEQWRTANAAAQREVWQRRHAKKAKTIPVPAWVPEDMRSRYVSRAMDKGEEYAASLARREKREAREAGL